MAPVVADEQLFAVDDKLRAFETQSGDQLWQADLGADIPGTGITVPAVTSAHVIIGAKERILAFDREDGAEEWERRIEGFPLGPVTVDRDHRLGILPVERPESDSAAGELITFELSSGEQRWTAPLRVSPYTVPSAVFNEQVFGVGYDEAETPVIRAFSLADGQLRWGQELSDPETPPVVTDSGVFIGDSGTLYQYTHSGEKKKEVTGTENDATFRAIAVAEETVFVLSNNGLSAVSVPDGERQWHFDATPKADGLCVGKDSIVAPVSSDEFDLDTSWPCIAAFSRSDGAVRWYHAVDDAFDPVISAPPVIADGAVFMMSNTRSGVTALGDLPPQGEE
jgi:outer membrane protein assembly factor BamB